jgi:endo-1,4-beta-xylanase
MIAAEGATGKNPGVIHFVWRNAMSLSRRQFIRNSAAAYAAIAALKSSAISRAAEESGLKDAFKGDFYIGTAVSRRNMEESRPEYLALLSREFNAMTMENNMKWGEIHPDEDTWNWAIPDKFVDFGVKNNMYMLGHCLVWHSQMAVRGFVDKDGKELSREAMLKRMQNHIATLIGRYKGRVAAWDAVNEAVDEDKGWRKSRWLNIIGEDFMDYAFNYAHEVDPRADLLYNDYNMHNPGKRQFVVNWVEGARKRGVPIKGIGMQGHVGLGYPDIAEFENSIVAYGRTGMKVHITEMDVDVLPVAGARTGAEISDSFKYSNELNPYVDGLPADIENKLADRYVEFFKLFLKHRDVIERVTFWGMSDGESWKNNFPVRGRTNYPLMFDRNYRRKACYDAVVSLKH